jgi:hypothetical protein
MRGPQCRLAGMADSSDELILKMQHLAAQAKASMEAEKLRPGTDRLKSAAQRLAWKAQNEVATLEKTIADADLEIEKFSKEGLQSNNAVAYTSARRRAEEAKHQLIRARAQLNFALDRLSEAERREFEAFHAEVRAQQHGDLAEDPLFNKG